MTRQNFTFQLIRLADSSASDLLDPAGALLDQWTCLTLSQPLPTTSTQVYKLSPAELLKDVSTFPTDPKGYSPSIGPQALSTGQQICLTIWAPPSKATNWQTLVTTTEMMTDHSSYMTPSPYAHGIGQPLLPNSWLKLAGAHKDGPFAVKLQKILNLVELKSGGGRPRSFFTTDGLQNEFGNLPAVTSHAVTGSDEVDAIP